MSGRINCLPVLCLVVLVSEIVGFDLDYRSDVGLVSHVQLNVLNLQ